MEDQKKSLKETLERLASEGRRVLSKLPVYVPSALLVIVLVFSIRLVASSGDCGTIDGPCLFCNGMTGYQADKVVFKGDWRAEVTLQNGKRLTFVGPCVVVPYETKDDLSQGIMLGSAQRLVGGK